MESVLQFFETTFGWPAADFWTTTAGTKGYALWSLTHFVMLGAAVLVALLFGVLYAVLRRRGRKAMQIVFTSLGFIVALAYQAELVFKTGTWTLADLPLGICGLSLLFCLLNTLWENGYCTEWLFAAALPVSLLSLCFPSWRALPVWSCAHLCQYLLPTIILIYAVMILFGGNLPSVKRLPAIAFTLLAVGVGFYFVNPVLETNFWGLTTRPAGLPWNWFAQLFGADWYLLGLPSAAYALWFVTYLPLTLIARAVKNNRVSKRLRAAFEDLPDISSWDKPAAPEQPAPAAEEGPNVVEIAAEETPAAETPVAEETAVPAENTEPAETVEAIETVESVESAETVEAVEVVESVEADENAEVGENAEAVEPVEVVETVEPIETAESAENTEAVEPVEPVEPVETVETVEPVENVESAEPVPAAEPAEQPAQNE